MKEKTEEKNFICANCGGDEFKVTRTINMKNGVRRERVCKKCQMRKFTEERDTNEFFFERKTRIYQ